MQKTILFLILFLIFESLYAQYINTDSLVIVPGKSFPVLLCEADPLLMDPPGILQGSGFGFTENQNMSAGVLLSRFTIPGNGKVISRFGWRSGRMHTGTDIKMDKGDTVYSSFEGVAACVRYFYGYGNMVVIEHGNGLETCYAHLSAFLVKKGQHIQQGQPIGLAGSTGRATTNHLHFEIRENEKPYDPELVFDFEKLNIRDEVKATDDLAALQKQLQKTRDSVDGAHEEHYTVKSGDSLWKISRRFKISIQYICMLNDLSEGAVLQVGQVLRLF
jgi:murein DD-endopeptidase MepM/ murein hydrolase activator NlpD